MSKRAEQKALEAYPIHSALIQPARRGGYYADTHFREGFINGYEQAEKDLALTWQDIKNIDDWLSVIQTSDNLVGKELYEEVLRKFNEAKNNRQRK